MDYDTYYISASETFDKNRLDGEDEVEEHCSWFAKSLNSNKAYTLLDIGCGTGRYTKSFAEKGILAIGIDKSQQQIEIASRKVPAMHRDALSLPFPDHSFDVISAIMMLQQIDDYGIEGLFDNINTVLRGKGKIWIKTCSKTDLERRPFNEFFPTALSLNDLRYPTIGKLLEIAKSYGFSCLRKTSKCNQYSIVGTDLLSRFREKHNTTLHMLPEKEFEMGVTMMEKQFHPSELYSFQHFHTLLELARL